MATITTKDGTTLYYKGWGTGKPVVFSHGWPLSSDSWEAQMMFLASHGYRYIAHGQVVPIGAAALRSSKLVKHATLKIYAGAPHGLAATHMDRLNSHLLEFIA